MNDKNYVLTGYAAAKLYAVGKIGSVRPGGKAILPLHPHTEEGKKEIELNEQWRIAQIYNYLLQNYGWRYAEKYKEENKEKIILYNIELEEAIPHCKYVEDGQCDLFCCFFNGGCNYENNL